MLRDVWLHVVGVIYTKCDHTGNLQIACPPFPPSRSSDGGLNASVHAHCSSMGFTDSIDAMLSGRERSRVKRNGMLMLLLLVTLDGACVVFIRESLAFVGLPRPQWTLSALLAALPSFSGDTVDVQLLFILRVLTISILAWVAVRVGQADLSSVKRKGDEGTVPITEPLLINAGPTASGPSCTCNGSSSHGPSCNGSSSHQNGGGVGGSGAGVGGGGGVGGGARKQAGHEVNTEHLESFRLKQAAEQRKNVLIAAVFIASTVSQCYVGIKCVSFVGVWPEHPEAMSVQGALMGLSVLFINIEAWLIKRLVNALTKEEGFFVPEFHPHPHARTPKVAAGTAAELGPAAERRRSRPGAPSHAWAQRPSELQRGRAAATWAPQCRPWFGASSEAPEPHAAPIPPLSLLGPQSLLCRHAAAPLRHVPRQDEAELPLPGV